jgi:hypothetical protein
MNTIVEYLNLNNGVAVIISSISAVIAAIAVGVAIRNNVKTHRQYRQILDPMLSMRLDDYGGFLYLCIQNTGRTAATNIKIEVKSIEHNGENKQLMLDELFEQRFELYPNETTHSEVALSGANVATRVFPTLHIDVFYEHTGGEEKVSYSRKVTFSRHYDMKVFADVNADLGSVEDSLDTTARSTVRMANYLDGCQMAPFDKLNILAGTSLQNDMCTAVESAKKSPIFDRTATITGDKTNSS